MKRTFVALSAVALLGLTACESKTEDTTLVAPDATETVAPLPVETPADMATDGAMADDTMTEDTMAEDTATDVATPAPTESPAE